jgi:hypothetical protein
MFLERHTQLIRSFHLLPLHYVVLQDLGDTFRMCDSICSLLRRRIQRSMLVEAISYLAACGVQKMCVALYAKSAHHLLARIIIHPTSECYPRSSEQMPVCCQCHGSYNLSVPCAPESRFWSHWAPTFLPATPSSDRLLSSHNISLSPSTKKSTKL